MRWSRQAKSAQTCDSTVNISRSRLLGADLPCSVVDHDGLVDLACQVVLQLPKSSPAAEQRLGVPCAGRGRRASRFASRPR